MSLGEVSLHIDEVNYILRNNSEQGRTLPIYRERMESYRVELAWN